VKNPLRTLLIVGAALVASACEAADTRDADWLAVGGDRGAMRYSELAQINRENVARLEVAWTYDTGDSERGLQKTIECTPLVIDGVMYITTASSRVVALDAASGEKLWEFVPPVRPGPVASGGVNRGVAYWEAEGGAEDGQRRILHGMADGRLWSLDARTGNPDPAFGRGGFIELRDGIERDISPLPYGPTSAPAIWENTVILGVSCGEGPGPVAPGDVRAFDVQTGRQVWRFHTVPRPGEFGNDTWEDGSWRDRGAANAWGGVSIDEARGRVFVGLGSAAFDFYGGDRPGQNLFANCVVCLDARTGQRVWHFQTLHHDLWDHDLPTYPNCVTVLRDGRKVDAVAQVTKTGYVFLFDRVTGKPLFEVEEQPAPTDGVPGERPWPTQPVPVKPPAFSRTTFTEDDVTDISPEARSYVLEQLESLRTGRAFEPPTIQGTVVVPGFHGGATWSGASFDPTTGILYVNSNNVPNILTLAKAPDGSESPYVHQGYNQFLDDEGYPAIKPPWGLLNAIDLNTGEFVWRVPLGEYPELSARGVPQTGTENFGGTIVTSGGLVFIGGSKDEKFHAFDAATGELLWQFRLPAGGYATPCTYMANGRQYVVIAAGGAGKLRTKAGDEFLAFALP
jgi:quinoprotein glucose dehydrogenase